MNQTIFNEYGEPIGTERIPDEDEQWDALLDDWDQNAYDDECAGCYFCGRTFPIDCMIPFEIKVANGRLEEVFSCTYCEEEIDDVL